MVGRIQELRDRLPVLMAEEKRLRSERTSVCFPEKDADGNVVLKIDNEPLYNELTEQMNAKAAERAKIQDKLQRLEEILGPNCQDVPTGYEGMDYLGRQKMELATYFINKILKPGNGDRYYTLPEDGLKDPRYLAVKADLMPEIEKIEADMLRTRELAAKANAILAEP